VVVRYDDNELKGYLNAAAQGDSVCNRPYPLQDAPMLAHNSLISLCVFHMRLPQLAAPRAEN
jgi:hypothetical protein